MQRLDQVAIPSAGANSPRHIENSIEKHRKRKGSLLVPVILQVLAMVGVGALVYTSAAEWFAKIRYDSEITGYVEQVQKLPTEQQVAMLQAAHDYNAQMPEGVLRDPYLQNEEGAGPQEDAAYLAYTKVLSLSDEGMIGDLTYPRLGIGLPIYHGTAESTLRKGIGHLYGSSLPVGGPSTHSVLTSHTGQVNAYLFGPLLKAELGDVFSVRVLGETLYYQVESIQTVLPEQTESLQIREGEDQVTLITCTPIGINSHRLLVTGSRIPAPDDAGIQAISGGAKAGFPWWLVIFLAGSGAIAALLFVPGKGRGKSSKGTS